MISSYFGLDDPRPKELQFKVLEEIGKLHVEMRLTTDEVEKIERAKIKMMKTVQSAEEIPEVIDRWKRLIADTLVKKS